MASIVETIYSDLKTQIEAALPARYESRFVWDLARNGTKYNRDLFAIRPGSSNNANTTNRAITLDQSFDVILSTDFKLTKDNDDALQTAIFGLYEDHETIYKFAFLSKFGIPRVLVVFAVDMGAPEIDNDNNVVSITASYTIKYRTALT